MCQYLSFRGRGQSSSYCRAGTHRDTSPANHLLSPSLGIRLMSKPASDCCLIHSATLNFSLCKHDTPCTLLVREFYPWWTLTLLWTTPLFLRSLYLDILFVLADEWAPMMQRRPASALCVFQFLLRTFSLSLLSPSWAPYTWSAVSKICNVCALWELLMRKNVPTEQHPMNGSTRGLPWNTSSPQRNDSKL